MTGQSANRDDFEMEQPQLADKTLEEVVADGESDEEKMLKTEHVTANNMAQWIASVLTNVKKKQHNLSNVSVAERLTAKLGIAVIRGRFGESIQAVAEYRERIYECTDQILLKKSYRGGNTYEFQETVGVVYRKISLWDWEAAAITETLVDPLALPISTAATLVLIAGISKSKDWVPKGWVKVANQELDNFQNYLENEARRLKMEVLGNG